MMKLASAISLCAICVYPFFVRLLFDTIDAQTVARYKDGECYLKLINETNSEHFNSHPLWSHRGYSSDCDAISYARLQATDNEIEGTILLYLNVLHVAMGLYFLTRTSLMGGGKSPFSITGAMQLLAFGWLAGMNFQYTLHYQHDMHHLVGNLVHHAGPGVIEEKGAGGARFGNSVPHGILPSILSYQLIVPCLIFLAHQAAYSPSSTLRPVLEYLGSSMIVSPVKMAIQSRFAHPYLHKEDQSLFPYPLSEIVDDYNCHIGQHHRDGTCLGVIDVKPLNEFYTFLMKTHGRLYSSGVVQRDSSAHTLINLGADYLLLFLTFLTFLAFFKVVSLFSPLFSSVSARDNVSGDKKTTKLA